MLKDGYVQQVDTRQNLYDLPTNVFVAAFIGSQSMNLYGSVTVDDNGGSERVGSKTVAFGSDTLETFPSLGQYNGQPVIIGIRPEDFQDAALLDADESPTDRRIRGTVKLVEALGPGTDGALRDRRQDGQLVRSRAGARQGHREFRRPLPPALARAPGQQLELAVTSDNFHFLDAQTHERIH